MDAIEALKTRRSVRAYHLKTVEREVLEDLIDCARLAPSGGNQQPCEFIVVTDSDLRDDLADACPTAPFLREAAACVAIVCHNQGLPEYDSACAGTCLMVAARAYGLGSCWFHVHGKEYEADVRELLGVPDDLQVVCLVTLGYGENPPPPDKRPLADVCHWDRF